MSIEMEGMAPQEMITVEENKKYDNAPSEYLLKKAYKEGYDAAMADAIYMIGCTADQIQDSLLDLVDKLFYKIKENKND